MYQHNRLNNTSFNLIQKFKNFDYIYIFYLLVFAYVNVKFYRIGGYGTDIAAQLIVLILIPLVLITIKKK